MGFVSATRNDSFVTAPPQLSAQLAFGFIPCRSPGDEQIQRGQIWPKKKKKSLANCVLIKQLIKFHLVHFPCNKALIMSGWEGFFWAGWGCECRATHTGCPDGKSTTIPEPRDELEGEVVGSDGQNLLLNLSGFSLSSSS